MKRQPAALTAPWAITQEGMRLVLGVWSRSEVYADVVTAARKRWEAGDLDSDRSGAAGVLRMVDDGKGGKCAVVGIQGPLFRHASMFTELSGATSYDALYKAIETSLADSSVSSILLRVNSPGGEADGVGELADYIGKAAKQKPVWAYVEGMGASAAYWLASQATRIVAYRAAEVGSIGVRITLVDHAKADAMEGLEEIEIVSAQSPDKRSTPIDDAVKARLQTRADDLAGLFVDAVAKARDVTAAKVASDFGSGDVLIASKALAAGMIDEIGDFNSTLAALAGARTRAGVSAQRINMSNPDPTVSATALPYEKQACASCGSTSMPPSFCKACMDDDEDEPDGDEMSAFGRAACESMGVATAAEARGKFAALVERAGKVEALESELATLRADGIKRDLRTALTTGLDSKRLSLGAIQKSIGAFVLRGDARATWSSTMSALETVNRDTVIDAACSVPVTPDDLASVRAYIDASAPTTAPTATEPPRDAKGESAEMDATVAEIDRIAAEVRKRYPTAGASAQAK